MRLPPSASDGTARAADQRDRRRRATAHPNKRACGACHYKKIRCDIITKGSPCTNCQSKGIAGCRAHDRKTSSSQRPTILRPLPSLRPRIEPARSVGAAENTSSSSSAYIETTSPVTVAKDSQPNDDGFGEGNLAEFFDVEAIRTAEIKQQSRMCYIGNQPSNFNYLIRQIPGHAKHDHIFHFANRQYSLRDTAYEIDRVPPDAFTKPPKEIVDSLVEAYFNNVNKGWPIVNQSDFMDQLNETNPQNPLSLPLFNAVLLVGAHVLSAQRPELRPYQDVFFRRTKVLVESRVEQNRLVYVQVALLLTWYSDGLEEVVANAWYWIGSAARTAMGLGMNRDSRNARTLDSLKRTWVCVWWVLLQFDTLISLSYGRPQCLNLDDCDVPMIQYEHFKELDQIDTDFVIQHTQLCIIISQTMRKRWALRATVQERIEATEQADETLARFIQQLPPALQPSLGYPNIWQASLHLTYNSFLLLLHRPPPRPDLSDAVSQACSNTDICADSSALLATLLDSLRAHGGLRSLCFFGVHTVFTALIFIKSQLCSSNPLVVAKAARSFKSFRAVLATSSWNFAKDLSRWTKGIEGRLEPGDNRAQPDDNSEATKLNNNNNNNRNSSSAKATPAASLKAGQNGRSTRSRTEAHKAPQVTPLTQQHSNYATAQPTDQAPINTQSNDTSVSAIEAFGLDTQNGLDYGNMLDDPLFTSIPLLDGFLFELDDGNSYFL